MYKIYHLINRNNGGIYVGMTKNGENRIKQHFRALKRNAHSNRRLQSDFNQGYVIDYVFLHKCDTESEASELEMKAIKKYRMRGHLLYNLNDGGSIGNKGYTQSDYAKRIASEVHSKRTGVKNSFYGKTHSDATKRLISEKNKGLRKGIPKSEQTRKRMMENHHLSKKVNVLGTTYISMCQAEKNTGINRKRIAKRARDLNDDEIYFVND